MSTPVQVIREPIDQIIRQIRHAMLDREWNQADLARYLGVTEHWVSRRLKRHTDLSVVELLRIAEALDVEVQALLPRTGQATVKGISMTFPPRRSLLPIERRTMRMTSPLADAA